MLSRGFKITQPKTFEVDIEDLNYSNKNTIVKIDYAAICKADIRYYLGNRDARVLGLKYPMRLIHEATGTVIKDSTEKFNLGDKVVLVPNICMCEKCDFEHVEDRSLGANYCPKVKFASSNYDGFSAECVSLPSNNLVRYNSEKITGEIAVFAELISVGCASIRRIKDWENKRIGIWGDGLVGYIFAHMIKVMFKQSKVVCVGIDENKLKNFDVDEVYLVNDLKKKSLKLDIGIECVGGSVAEKAINQMLEHTKFGGDIILAGVSEEGANINTRRILEKGIKITGSTRSTVEDFEKAVSLLESEKFSRYIEKLVLSINTINNITDYYNSFEIEVNNKKLGKNILKMEL